MFHNFLFLAEINDGAYIKDREIFKVLHLGGGGFFINLKTGKTNGQCSMVNVQ